MITEVSVTFTEIVTRTLTFDLEIEEGVWTRDGRGNRSVLDLQCSDIHELMDRQNAWDQVVAAAWLGGDIENRVVDEFEVIS